MAEQHTLDQPTIPIFLRWFWDFIRFIKQAGAIATIGAVVTGGIIGGIFVINDYINGGGGTVVTPGGNTANDFVAPAPAGKPTCVMSSALITYTAAVSANAVCDKASTAYVQVAPTGGLVRYETGSYGADQINQDPTTGANTPTVTFSPDTASVITYTATLSLGGSCGGCNGVNPPNHVTLDGTGGTWNFNTSAGGNWSGGVRVNYNYSNNSRATNLVFSHLNIAQGQRFDGGAPLTLQQPQFVSIDHVNIGPICCGSLSKAGSAQACDPAVIDTCGANSPVGFIISLGGNVNNPNPDSISMTDSTIQYILRTCADWPTAGYGACPSGDVRDGTLVQQGTGCASYQTSNGNGTDTCHVDGTQIYGVNNFTFERNTIYEADAQALFFGNANGGTFGGTNLIDHNFLGVTLGSNCSFCVSVGNAAGSVSGNWTINNNTGNSQFRFSNMTSMVSGTVVHFNGNIGTIGNNNGGSGSCTGGTGITWTYSYNRWSNITCDATDALFTYDSANVLPSTMVQNGAIGGGTATNYHLIPSPTANGATMIGVIPSASGLCNVLDIDSQSTTGSCEPGADTISISTWTSGTGSGNVWVAPASQGAPASCTWSSSLISYATAVAGGRVCNSFQGAETAAATHPGAVVIVATGAYPQQVITSTQRTGVTAGTCAATWNESTQLLVTNYTNCVTFQPATGTAVTVGGIYTNGIGLRFRNFVIPDGSLSVTWINVFSGTQCSPSVQQPHDDVFDGNTLYATASPTNPPDGGTAIPINMNASGVVDVSFMNNNLGPAFDSTSTGQISNIGSATCPGGRADDNSILEYGNTWHDYYSTIAVNGGIPPNGVAYTTHVVGNQTVPPGGALQLSSPMTPGWPNSDSICVAVGSTSTGTCDQNLAYSSLNYTNNTVTLPAGGTFTNGQGVSIRPCGATNGFASPDNQQYTCNHMAVIHWRASNSWWVNNKVFNYTQNGMEAQTFGTNAPTIQNTVFQGNVVGAGCANQTTPPLPVGRNTCSVITPFLLIAGNGDTVLNDLVDYNTFDGGGGIFQADPGGTIGTGNVLLGNQITGRFTGTSPNPCLSGVSYFANVVEPSGTLCGTDTNAPAVLSTYWANAATYDYSLKLGAYPYGTVPLTVTSSPWTIPCPASDLAGNTRPAPGQTLCAAGGYENPQQSGSPGQSLASCSPNPCTAGTLTQFTVSAFDSDGSDKKLVTRKYWIYRPTGLTNSMANQVPLVISTDTTLTDTGDTVDGWDKLAPANKFVAVLFSPSDQHPVGGQFASLTVARQPFGAAPLNACGTSGASQCDDIPALLAVLNAVICSGASPCQNVDPHKVYIAGASKGGTFTHDAICDQRTSNFFTAAASVSATLLSLGPNDQTIAPSCPMVMGTTNGLTNGLSGDGSVRNNNFAFAWLYGDHDSVGCSAANLACINTGGFAGTSPTWTWGFSAPQEAGATSPPAGGVGANATGRPGGSTVGYGYNLGCSGIPSTTINYGTGNILHKNIYTGCTHSNRAMMTILVNGGGHSWVGIDLVNGTPTGLDAYQTTWDFFKAYGG